MSDTAAQANGVTSADPSPAMVEEGRPLEGAGALEAANDLGDNVIVIERQEKDAPSSAAPPLTPPSAVPSKMPLPVAPPETPPPGALAAMARSLGLTPARTAEECLSLDQIRELRQRALAIKAPSDELSEELSAALGVAQRIRSRKIFIEGADRRLYYVMDCLEQTPPMLVLARDDRLRLQLDAYRHSSWLGWMLATVSSGSTTGLVLTALVSSTIIWAIVMISIWSLVDKSDLLGLMFFMNSAALAVITSAAFVGGAVSIATRLKDFARARDLDPFAVFWTAMLKPLIGVVLSIFILAALYGQIVSFGFLNSSELPSGDVVPTAKGLYILWVLGFLAGFSERFAWDFVDRAQGVAAAAPTGK